MIPAIKAKTAKPDQVSNRQLHAQPITGHYQLTVRALILAPDFSSSFTISRLSLAQAKWSAVCFDETTKTGQ